MSTDKSQQEKARLHPRNKNRDRYNLKALIKSIPELGHYVMPNKYGEDSIDFSDPGAVKALNTALLNHYYGIKYWEFPDTNLCPPIPGRADYIHHIADLLRESNFGTIPTGDIITCLDIGVGASCIYPIIGVAEYGWKFIGSDIEPKSIKSAQHIANANKLLKDKIEFRLQEDRSDVLFGILGKEEKIDLTICNPPFHSSSSVAQEANLRKVKNLSKKPVKAPKLNFAGISNELICDGGEYKFILNLVRESEKFSKNCYWFSTLVSKQSNLRGINKALEKVEAKEIKTIPMGTGNKASRIVAWTFLTPEEQKEWKETRWKVNAGD